MSFEAFKNASRIDVMSFLGFLPPSKCLSWSHFLHGVLPPGHFRRKESYDAIRDPESCQPGLGQVRALFYGQAQAVLYLTSGGNTPPYSKTVRKEGGNSPRETGTEAKNGGRVPDESDHSMGGAKHS